VLTRVRIGGPSASVRVALHPAQAVRPPGCGVSAAAWCERRVGCGAPGCGGEVGCGSGGGPGDRVAGAGPGGDLAGRAVRVMGWPSGRWSFRKRSASAGGAGGTRTRRAAGRPGRGRRLRSGRGVVRDQATDQVVRLAVSRRCGPSRDGTWYPGRRGLVRSRCRAGTPLPPAPQRPGRRPRRWLGRWRRHRGCAPTADRRGSDPASRPRAIISACPGLVMPAP